MPKWLKARIPRWLSDWWESAVLVMRAFSGIVIFWLASIGVVLYFLPLFGNEAKKTHEFLGLDSPHAPWLITLLFIASAFLAFHKAYKAVQEDFYSNNEEARKDRAYREISRIHRRGLACQEGREGDPSEIVEWDKEIRKALKQYSPVFLDVYLLNTERTGMIGPLKPEMWETALRQIGERLLERDEGYLGRF